MSDVVAVAEPVEKAVVAQVVMPAKRKPGRPRKHPVPKDLASKAAKEEKKEPVIPKVENNGKVKLLSFLPQLNLVFRPGKMVRFNCFKASVSREDFEVICKTRDYGSEYISLPDWKSLKKGSPAERGKAKVFLKHMQRVFVNSPPLNAVRSLVKESDYVLEYLAKVFEEDL